MHVPQAIMPPATTNDDHVEILPRRGASTVHNVNNNEVRTSARVLCYFISFTYINKQ